jgi:hypothetical protein
MNPDPPERKDFVASSGKNNSKMDDWFKMFAGRDC